MLKKLVAVVITASVAATPVMAAPASSLSLAPVAAKIRAGSTTAKTQKFSHVGALAAGLLGAGAIAAFVAVAFDNKEQAASN